MDEFTVGRGEDDRPWQGSGADPEAAADAAETHLRGFGRRARELLGQTAVVARMARAVAGGQYDLATPKVLMVVGTLGYVAMPIDAVPEAILGPLGLSDDMAAVAWLTGALAYEISCFVQWESEQGGSGGGLSPSLA